MQERRAAGRRTYYAHVLLGAILYGIILCYPLLSPILLSFVLIMLGCLAINPVVESLQRFVGQRSVAASLGVGLFVAMIGLAVWIFMVPLKNSGSRFLDQMPEYWQRMQKPLVKMEHKAEISEEKLKDEVAVEVAREQGTTPERAKTGNPISENTTEKSSTSHLLRSTISLALDKIGESANQLVSNVASLILVCVTVFFGMIFALLNPHPILGSLFGLVPQQHHAKAKRIMRRVAMFVPQWAKATGQAMFCVGCLVFFATWPIFGLADALVLGLIAALLEAVPYLGPVLASVPALLLAVGVGGWTPLWVILIYVAIQALECNVISPLIMAGQLKLHPVAVIFGMLLSVVVFGVLGVVVAVPMVAIVQILYEELYRPRFLPDVTNQHLDAMARSTLGKGET